VAELKRGSTTAVVDPLFAFRSRMPRTTQAMALTALINRFKNQFEIVSVFRGYGVSSGDFYLVQTPRGTYILI
jgi:hypothetical protein